MGILLLQFRKMNLIQQQQNVEYQLTDINQQLNDYMSLSSTLANDSLTMADVASIPPSLFGAGIGALTNMHAQSSQYANQVLANMQAGSVFDQWGENSGYMQQIAYLKAYEQGQEQIKKRIQAQLNQKEKQLKNKQATLEAKQTMIDTELQKVDQRLAKDMERSVAGYGLGGQ